MDNYVLNRSKGSHANNNIIKSLALKQMQIKTQIANNMAYQKKIESITSKTMRLNSIKKTNQNLSEPTHTPTPTPAPRLDPMQEETTSSISNPKKIPIRHQWDENYGYCGETTFITANLMVGQYFSQFDIRSWSGDFFSSSNNINQGDPKNQLLFQTTFPYLAKKCHLISNTFLGKSGSFSDTSDFKTWMTSQFTDQNTTNVIIGVYENLKKFYDWYYDKNGYSIPGSTPGKNYDHIVNLTNINSNDLWINDVGNYANYKMKPEDTADDDTYASKKLSVYENASAYPSAEKSQHFFQIEFNDGILDRKKSDDSLIPYMYTIPYFTKDMFREPSILGNVGISIGKLTDKGPNNETLLPISIKTDLVCELPSVHDSSDDDGPKNNQIIYSNNRPFWDVVTLNITISELKTNKEYTVYKFSDITKVTKYDSNFIDIEAATNNFCLTFEGGRTGYGKDFHDPESGGTFYKNDPIGFRGGNISFEGEPLSFMATSNTYSFTDYGRSCDQHIYRCVPKNNNL